MIDKLENYTAQGRGKDLLKIAKHSAEHLQNLVNDILDMSRIENDKFEVQIDRFDIHQTVSDVI